MLIKIDGRRIERSERIRVAYRRVDEVLQNTLRRISPTGGSIDTTQFPALIEALQAYEHVKGFLPATEELLEQHRQDVLIFARTAEAVAALGPEERDSHFCHLRQAIDIYLYELGELERR